MATFDILVLVVVVLAGINGFRKGLVIEVFSLLAFFVGLFVALKLTFPLTSRLFDDSDSYLFAALVIFIGLFILIVWVAKIFATSIKRVIDFTPAGIIDNILGVGISMIKWLFIISTILWAMDSLDMQMPREWTRNSDFYEGVIMIAPVVVEFVSSVIPWFQDIIETMKEPLQRV